MASDPPIPASITVTQFTELLRSYTSTIASISNAAKKSDENLEVLDNWYRTELVETIKSRPDQQNLFKLEVQKTVEYKLKRGKFRPSLMGFASALDEKAVIATSAKAFKLLPESTPTKEQIIAGVRELSTLKGIGPATASYLLAAFRPEDVPIFSDEAFRWVFYEPGTGKGWERKIKYDIKEYSQFVGRVKEVADRLGVNPAAVEMVGFVLGKGGVGSEQKSIISEKKVKKIVGEKDKLVNYKVGTVKKGKQSQTSTTKRKREEDGTLPVASKKLTAKEAKTGGSANSGAAKPSNMRVTRSRSELQK